jgi:hypothetical protein
MLELEHLGERVVPSVLIGRPPLLRDLLPPAAVVSRALDSSQLLTGSTSLRENFDIQAGQVRGLLDGAEGLLQPGRRLMMETFLADFASPPQPIPVNPSYPIPPGHQTVYYVNGILTTPGDAVAEAQALADQLGRPVDLLYDPTQGLAGDVLQTLGDLLWSPPLPQPDRTARELAGLLLSARQSGQTVDIVAYSRGAATANDALRAVDALGLGPWAYSHVAEVLVAAPLGPFQAAGTAHLRRIDNTGDPVVEFLGDRRASLLAKLDPATYDPSVSIPRHFFLGNYVNQVTTAALF